MRKRGLGAAEEIILHDMEQKLWRQLTRQCNDKRTGVNMVQYAAATARPLVSRLGNTYM